MDVTKLLYGTVWASALPLLMVVGTLGQTGAKKAKTAPPTPKAALTGEQVFKQQCAPCHGVKGEGTENYSRSLTGNQSVGQLAKYIAAEMPPGSKHCSAPNSQKVAAYIFDSFYSPLAQERNRPARVALSRMTVRQLRNSVSDLVGSFRPIVPLGTEHGLKGEYFKAKRFQDTDRVLQRVDPEVKFDFGTVGPTGATFEPHQFSIRWNGSVVAPDTGVYEIIVRTEHALRLWVSDNKKPVVDAWVKSGNDNEYRASLFLIGGRAYPLRLEFSKSTQGVDDTKKKEGKPAPPASIALSWKRPKQVAEETIPSRFLYTSVAPDAFVAETPFPPDDRSMGYERGTSVSKSWDEATTSAALETSDYVVKHLADLAGTTDDPIKLRAFCVKWAERAFRRPLDAAGEKLYIDKQFAATTDPQMAVKRVVLLTLKSPRFLYPDVQAKSDAYDTATRLSYTLWDSLPDPLLLQAAASGQLATREQIVAQAERMVADPRAWYKEREFYLQWLKIDQYPDLTKDAKRFPNFTPAVITDLRTSLDMTLENVIQSEHSDFRELVLTDKVYLNGRLAPIYGVSLAPDAPFQPVALNPGVRSGILTHPYVLASFAYTATTSPIHRGVLLTRSVMGRTLQPPPAAFAPLAADLHPKLTTRQRVSLQTKPAACMACHGIINPLGFTLERFDAIGRLRTAENGSPIDSSGSYQTKAGKLVKFTGARDLGQFVADSDEVHASFVEKLFQYEVKQPIRAYGTQALPELERTFKENGYNVRQLVVAIATESAFSRKK